MLLLLAIAAALHGRGRINVEVCEIRQGSRLVPVGHLAIHWEAEVTARESRRVLQNSVF